MLILLQEDGRGITAEREGYDGAESAFLHHRMKYSSHGNNDPLLAIERYTHSISSANDPNSAGHETINVSITCSRIPQMHGIPRQASDWSTQKSSLTTSSGQIWRGASKNANPQISRKKDSHKTSIVVSAHPPLRLGSRVSEKGGHSGYGVVTTDNHKRSTSLPLPLPHQPPLVQPTGLKKATTTTTTIYHNHITEPSQIRQNLMPHGQTSSSANAYKQQGSDTISSAAAVAPRSATKEEEEEGGDIMRPSKSLRVYLASHVGPSIAPAGVRAVATHRLRPVTSNTIVKGRGLVTGAR